MVSLASTTLSCLKGTMLKTFLRRSCLHLVVLVVALRQVSAENTRPGCCGALRVSLSQKLNRVKRGCKVWFANGAENPSERWYAFWTVIKNVLTFCLLISLLVIIAGSSVEGGVSSYASVSKGILALFLVFHFCLSLWYSVHYQDVQGKSHRLHRQSHSKVTFPMHLIGIVLIFVCLFYSNFEGAVNVEDTHRIMTLFGSMGLALIGLKYFSHTMVWLFNERTEEGYKSIQIIRGAWSQFSCPCEVNCPTNKVQVREERSRAARFTGAEPWNHTNYAGSSRAPRSEPSPRGARDERVRSMYRGHVIDSESWSNQGNVGFPQKPIRDHYRVPRDRSRHHGYNSSSVGRRHVRHRLSARGRDD